MNTLLLKRRNRLNYYGPINHGPIKSYLDVNDFKLVQHKYDPRTFERKMYFNKDGHTIVLTDKHYISNPNYLEENGKFWLDIK